MGAGPHSGNVALVTGGAGGIGRAIVAALAADGHAVAVADVDEQGAGAVAATVDGLAVTLDVTDEASVEAAVGAVEERSGRSTCSSTAPAGTSSCPFLETDEQFWRKVIAINFEGALRTTRALLGGMVERGWGRIVNVSSDAARVGSRQEAVYAGAKAGWSPSRRRIAREAASSGVTANVVCPGPDRDGDAERDGGRGTPDSERIGATHPRRADAPARAPRGRRGGDSVLRRSRTPATSPVRPCPSAAG